MGKDHRYSWTKNRKDSIISRMVFEHGVQPDYGPFRRRKGLSLALGFKSDEHKQFMSNGLKG